MSGGPTQLLNSCLKCGMKFENTEQLATHQKKFCIGDNLAELDHLEKKLKEPVKHTKSPFLSEGFSPLDKGVPLDNGKNEFDRLYTKANQDREFEMQKDLEKLKLEKADIRAKKQHEEEILTDLIRETELKKERDIRARIERDQIKKEIVSLEKTKLTALEQEKKNQLEKLAADRELLRQKEENLLKEVNKLETDMRTMDKVREEDIKKQEDVLDTFKRKGTENTKVNEILLTDKSDKVAQLKLRREHLELERQRIMGDLEKVKSGDLGSLRKSNYSVIAAKEMLNDMRGISNYGISDAKEKIYRDEQKLDQLKGDHRNILQKEHIYPEFAYGSPPTNPALNSSNYIPRAESTSGLQRNHLNMSVNQSLLGSHNYNNQIPPEFQTALSAKDAENLRLKQELEALKIHSIKPQTPNNNLTLANMNLKFTGVSSSAPVGFNLYSDQREFFLQNEARSVDLNEDEKYLLNLQAQEADSLRILSQIPLGTDLYRFKMEQYKELSTMRTEAEKIVQEHRLMKMRRDFEKMRREEDRKFENERWIDEQRKNVIASRLRDETQPTKAENRYDPLDGLVIYWDYALGIPKRNDSCQIVFGIYINGDEIYPPKLVEPHPCEIDTAVTNRCILGNSYPMNDIPANSNALLIFEVQVQPSRETGNPRLTSFGWSQLDLFDSRRELRRGKFKVPLYQCPTNTSQDIDGIKYLTPVHDGISWIYIRISYPGDMDIGRADTLYPESTHMEYTIPQIHLRSYRPPAETQFGQQQRPVSNMAEYVQPMPYEPYQNPVQNYSPQEILKTLAEKQSMLESFLQPPQKPHAKMPTLSQYDAHDQDRNFDHSRSAKLPDVTNLSRSQSAQSKKAVQIGIHVIRNHVARNHLRVSFALLEEAKMISDEVGQMCVFNTQIHNPAENLKNTSIHGPGSRMNNKAQGNNIVFKEHHKFFVDLSRLIAKNRSKKDYFLMLQVLEKPEPDHMQFQHQTMSYKASDASNFGKLEYDLLGWLLFKVNKNDGRMHIGKFSKNLFSSPLKKPPFDFSNEKTMDAEIEFSIDEVEWDDEEQEDNYDEVEEEKPAPRYVDKKPTKNYNQPINNNQRNSPPSPEQHQKVLEPSQTNNKAFIANQRPQYIERPFEKTMGVDFYFDGCKLLPDNITVAKATVKVVDSNFNIIKPGETVVSELDGPSYNPLFDSKTEIRPPNLPPTAIGFITIMTVDESSSQPKVVGYSAFNLFINKSTKTPPTSNNDKDIILMNGNYQLPIYCEDISTIRPFVLSSLTNIERIPAASVLIRVNQAPTSEDKRILNLSTVPERDWQTKKVKIPRPSYTTGVYNTSFFNIQDVERKLFISQLNRDNLSVREVAEALLIANKVKTSKDSEIINWLKNNIQPISSSDFINMIYFAKYRSDLGFKIALDGVHNAKITTPLAGVLVMNPPGNIYHNIQNPSQMHVVSNLDWEGPLLTPRFSEGYITWNNIPYEYNSHIVVEIKTVNLAKNPPQVLTLGWTIVPLFTSDGYFLSGNYQIPLLEGNVNKLIAQEIMEAQDGPWNYILQQINSKKPVIKWLQNVSVIVRLLDAQREGHFNKAMDYDKIDVRYLPKANISKYLYTGALDAKARQGKPLKSILPRKDDITAYNQKLEDAIHQELGL